MIGAIIEAMAYLVLAFAVVLSSGPLAPRSIAAPGSPVSAPTVEKVLAFYQTEAMLADVMPIFAEAMTRRRDEVKISDARAAQILALAGRIYRKKNLYSVFKVAYSKATTMENLTALYGWQVTPIGIRLRQAYASHYKSNWTAWRKNFPKNAIKPNRKNAISTYIVTTKQTDIYAHMQVGSDLGVHMALEATASPSSRDKEHVIRDKLKMRRPGYVMPAMERFLIHDYSLFKPFKNDEIDELTAFAATPAGLASFEAYNKALESTMEAAARTLANEVVKATK